MSSVEFVIRWPVFVTYYPRIRCEDDEEGQFMADCDLVVIKIVRGRNFHAAGAEFRIDVFIGDNGYLAPGQLQLDFFTDQFAIAFIIRMPRQRGIPQHSFRTRGGDYKRVFATYNRITDMPQMPGFLFRDNL